MAKGLNYDAITDTHLSKKYNDVLYDCIMRCNVTGWMMESTPHFDNLQSYFAAVYVFYRNTFMLFAAIPAPNGGKGTLMFSLMDSMNEVRADMRGMKLSNTKRTRGEFEKVVEKCDMLHMLIMFGLQKRHMLVRMSESEPRGEESVLFWKDKTAFKKGGVKGKLIEQKKKEGLFKRY